MLANYGIKIIKSIRIYNYHDTRPAPVMLCEYNSHNSGTKSTCTAITTVRQAEHFSNNLKMCIEFSILIVRLNLRKLEVVSDYTS